MLRVSGLFSDAVSEFDKLVERDGYGDDAWVLAHRGAAKAAMGYYDEAIWDLAKATKFRPKYAWAHAQIGETHRLFLRDNLARCGKYGTRYIDEAVKKSVDAFDLAIQYTTQRGSQASGYAWAYAHRGALHAVAFWVYQTLHRQGDSKLKKKLKDQEQGHFAMADKDLRKASELNPAYSWAIAFRAMIYAVAGKLPEANDIIGKALQADVNHNLPARRALCELSAYGQDFGAAAQNGWLALREDWQDFVACYFTAVSLHELGHRHADAAIHLAKNVVMKTWSVTIAMLGGIEAMLGDTKAAAKRLKTLHKYKDLEALFMISKDKAWEPLRQHENYQQLFDLRRPPGSTDAPDKKAPDRNAVVASRVQGKLRGVQFAVTEFMKAAEITDPKFEEVLGAFLTNAVPLNAIADSEGEDQDRGWPPTKYR